MVQMCIEKTKNMETVSNFNKCSPKGWYPNCYPINSLHNLKSKICNKDP